MFFRYKDSLLTLLQRKWFLAVLFSVNLIGTIYGFYWYKNQLLFTNPKVLDIFVPDSPTASAFFTLVLLAYLCSRRSPFLEAFASITLFKYGIWAVTMIILGGLLDPHPFFQAVSWEEWMLVVSHLGMAVEAVLYAPFYTYSLYEIYAVGAWMFLNDAMDYGLDLHPWLTQYLEPFHGMIGVFTLLLSCTAMILFTIFSMLSSNWRKWDNPLWISAGR